MKTKFRILLIVLLYPIALFAQEKSNANNLHYYKLDNGLSVFLNEDHSMPNVLGAVVIKTGGKYDPANATGTSHYLEHMLFKGTDMIGTVDYEAEKKYLKQIAELYELLSKLESNQERDSVQKEINRISLMAGKYAIPNELDKLIDNIGGTMVNAFTSEELVAYFNMFPSHQLDAWLYLYSMRFTNPVFRLFQAELETVFEEKNMYDDNFITALIENFYANLYKNHPYGQQTILGSTEHIKNPSLMTMQKMYDTYYVANNMALVLAGNFNIKEVIPIIEKYYSVWPSGKIPEFPEFKEEPFNGAERITQRLTPVRIGLKGFRTVPQNHSNRPALELAENILSNYYSTGYLDRLTINNKLMGAECFNDFKQDHGALVVLYVPKILGQSFNKAEKTVHQEILRLQQGDIDLEFFEAVKLSMIKEYNQSFEDLFSRIFLITEVFYGDKTWEEVVKYPEIIKSLTIEDVQKVSKKYLGGDYLSFRSKMGFPKKESLDKPGFDPVIPESAEAQSEFAKKFEEISKINTKPEYVDFTKDLEYVDFSGKYKSDKFYYVHTDVNDIFNFEVRFYAGNYHNNKYPQLAEYLSLIGTEKHNLEEFNKLLQSVACSFSVYSNDEFFVISVDGLNEHFEESLRLISELLNNPAPDKSKHKNLKQNASFIRKFEAGNPDDVSRALYNYALYGDNSPQLRRMTKKEVKKLKCEDLLGLLEETLKMPYSVHYSGALEFSAVADVVKKHYRFKTGEVKNELPLAIPRKEYTENTIVFLDDKKALQSSIYFYVNGNVNDIKERALAQAFNKYFGSGMASLVFQEIREFRSMAYAAYGFYHTANNPDAPGYLTAYVGTQADKTIEAISIMDSLIHRMPKKDRVNIIKTSLLQSINSSKPSKRDLSASVEKWLLNAYESDPREVEYHIFNQLSLDNILDFHQANVAKRPMVITIVGNSNSIDMQELGKFGKIVTVKKKDVFN
jgi:zinc protease